jgi:hypothetical protein
MRAAHWINRAAIAGSLLWVLLGALRLRNENSREGGQSWPQPPF